MNTTVQSELVASALRIFEIIGVLAFARHRQAARAGRVGTMPRAAGIDHRPRLDHLARLQVHLERLVVAPLGADLVKQ